MYAGCDPRRFSISVRLRILFAAVVILMVAGSVLSFWQFRNISRSASRLSNVEQRVTSLLRLNNNLLTLMGHLHRSAEPRDPLLFETEGLAAAK